MNGQVVVSRPYVSELLAIVDELETPKHVRRRFTVAY